MITLNLLSTFLLQFQIPNTPGKVLLAYDVMEDGTLSDKRSFAKLKLAKGASQGGTDGMAVDSQGNVYAATTKGIGVQIFNKEGKYLGNIKTPTPSNNVSFGGDAQMQFLVSGEMKRNDVIIKNTGFDRYSIQTNLDHNFGNNITIHSSSNYINSEAQRGWTGKCEVGSVVQGLYNTPTFAQHLPNDKGNYPNNLFFQMNTLELIEYGKNNQEINRFLQAISTDIDLYNKGVNTLKLRVDRGFDFLNSNSMVFMPRYLQYQQNQPNPGDLIHSAEKDLKVNLNAFMVYDAMLGPENYPWDLTSQLGYTTLHIEQNLQQIRGHDLVPGQTNIENVSIQQIYNQFFENVTDVGHGGQQKANWDDKVKAIVDARFDKSTLNRIVQSIKTVN